MYVFGCPLPHRPPRHGDEGVEKYFNSLKSNFMPKENTEVHPLFANILEVYMPQPTVQATSELELKEVNPQDT
tara:strand:+ start:5997 stop:6215 length:219 start_codon:yes stop_codon:yes gene_type:complete